MITLFGSEIALRSLFVHDGHIERLRGERWCYLVPIDVDNMPDVGDSLGNYRRYDPMLGWTIIRLGKQAPLYYSDTNGFRCSSEEHELARQHRDGVEQLQERELVYDVVALGDSFTHGNEVRFQEAWPYRLAKRTGGRVLNLGVGGYGIDQAILRYQYTSVRAPVVLLGIVPEDLDRARTQIFPLASQGGFWSKPLFLFDSGRPRIVNQPAIRGEALRTELNLASRSAFLKRETLIGPEQFEHHWLDFLYLYRVPRSVSVNLKYHKPRIFVTPGRELQESVKILQYGKKLAADRGARLLVVLLGHRTTFRMRRTMADPWRILKRALREADIEYMSVTDELYRLFREDPHSVINENGSHYTPQAHDIVARSVAESEVARFELLPAYTDSRHE